MGLNRISNPKQLRRLSRIVGKPIILGYARAFENQNQILAFASETEAYVVHNGVAERFGEPVQLLDYGYRRGL